MNALTKNYTNSIRDYQFVIYTVERSNSSENFERKQNLNFDRPSVKFSAFEIWIIVELLSNNFFPFPFFSFEINPYSGLPFDLF